MTEFVVWVGYSIPIECQCHVTSAELILYPPILYPPPSLTPLPPGPVADTVQTRTS